MGESFTYTIHYEDGSQLTMPFSRELRVGDTWRDTIAEWRVIRMGAAAPGEAVEVWVEPVRDSGRSAILSRRRRVTRV